MPEPDPRPDGREPTIADRVAAILAAWDCGAVTHAEVTNKIYELLTPANIDEVVAATSGEWRDDLVDHLRDIGESEGPLITISGGIWAWELERDPVRRAEMLAAHERERAAEAAHFDQVMRPAIRAWLRRQRPDPER